MHILITGAAGNLGRILAKHLLTHSSHNLNLMTHCTSLPYDLQQSDRVKNFNCDLRHPSSLTEACQESDVIIHFAGVLFAPHPEKFLPKTNTQYTENLVNAALEHHVKRFIIVSFPHVEGPTSKENPCANRQDQNPVSVHAKTRLEAEKCLFEKCKNSPMQAISLRPGMIYAKNILMVSFAKKLAKKRLLGVWKEPTPIHLISRDDFNTCCQNAIEDPAVEGIYPLGDESPLTLQEFLDCACAHWKLHKPWRVPLWSVYLTAWLCEKYAWLFDAPSPFTKDFIDIGRVPYFCDTKRMRQDLITNLKYPSLKEGLEIL